MLKLKFNVRRFIIWYGERIRSPTEICSTPSVLVKSRLWKVVRESKKHTKLEIENSSKWSWCRVWHTRSLEGSSFSLWSGKELKNLMMLHDGEACERMRGGDEEEDCRNTKPFQHGLGQCGHTTSSTPSSSLSTSYPFPSPHLQRTLPTTSSYTPVTIWFSGMRFRAVVSKWKGWESWLRMCRLRKKYGRAISSYYQPSSSSW